MDIDSTLIKYLFGASGGGAILGFLATWGWNRYWQKKDQSEASVGSRLTVVESKVTTVEGKVTAIEIRDSDRMKSIGKIEGEITRLDGKLDGLQNFWRTKFEKFEEKLDAFKSELRVELRNDQTAHESRMTTMLESHRIGVHNRLNEATAAQATMLNDLIDKLVDKVGDDKEKTT